MLYLLDTADVEAIAKAAEVFPLSGVTTNPTIISHAKRDFFAILKDIRGIIGDDKMLHAQMMGETCDEIIRDAETLREKITGDLYVKIPVTIEGYKAMPILKKRGFKITATAIFSPGQAMLAASWGVDFTAPYLNRIDNISGMGVEVVRMITQMFRTYNLKTRVLAASFKDLHQVTEVAMFGCDSITVQPDILWKMASHALTDLSVKQFNEDWRSVYGEGKCIYNL